MRLILTGADLLGDTLRLGLRIEPLHPGLPPDAVLAHLHWNRPDAPWPPTPLPLRALRPAEGGFRALLPLPPPDRSLHGVSVVPARPGDVLEEDDGTASRLARLFPRTDEEYVALFQSETRRWGHRKTRFFLAAQIARFFPGAPEHRIGAALVMGYKAAEIGERDVLLAALEVNGAALGWLAPLGLDWHPRRNREHLEISLLTVRWHLQLALGDEPATRATLRSLLERCQARASYWTLAYSACKSLVLGGWLEWRHGESGRARESWERCVAIFKTAVQEADPARAVLFKELSVSHEAAHFAGLCLRALARPRHHPMPPLEQILDVATRVPPPSRAPMAAAILAVHASSRADGQIQAPRPREALPPGPRVRPAGDAMIAVAPQAV
ncbi:hypothetical protein SAMN02745194_03354 [Roseomonas rosea]|uniref:Uncharacterized protein n=1 Tax=Muricoccus roseus TaxID=198092 RepID=A0A1M6M4A7_9PROT|nr:hypothetical protein [Roseomonas rosea]SHJ78271.1 hypothetical protein SAMN02745194_03354 [Roseomonas rosea]